MRERERGREGNVGRFYTSDFKDGGRKLKAKDF